MSKGGGLPSESTVHEKMFGCRDEPLRAAQYMADLHVMIIYYVSKVIGGKSICFYHHRVPFHLQERMQGMKTKENGRKQKGADELWQTKELMQGQIIYSNFQGPTF